MPGPTSLQSRRSKPSSYYAPAGEVVWVDEEAELNAVTAVSGSGPAYFFLLMEAMIAAGARMGLSPALAEKLTLQTAYGASLMALQSDASPEELRADVTSPGGRPRRRYESCKNGT